MTELKKCPFCSGLVKVAPYQGKALSEKLLMCCTNKICPNEGNLFYLDEWQSRPLEDVLQAKLAIAVEALRRIHEYHDGYCENHINVSKHSHGLDDIAVDAIAEIEKVKDE
jgi:hypothetical protein